MRRKYAIADVYLLEYAKTMRHIFVGDLALFTAFDADFNAGFAANWQADINAAQDEVSDRSVVKSQAVLSSNVEKAMKNCRIFYHEVKFFVLKTFPDDVSVHQAFGFDDYLKARKSQTKLIEFMQDVHTTALKYEVQLAANNFDALKIANIKDLADALIEANQNQNEYIKGRPAITAKRIAAYNKVWATITLVSRASKIIFSQNPPKFNQYLLPASNENGKLFALKGRITNVETKKPITGAQVSIESLDIAVKTDSNGRFGMSKIAPGSYKLSCSAPNYIAVTLSNIAIFEDHTTKQNFKLKAISPPS